MLSDHLIYFLIHISYGSHQHPLKLGTGDDIALFVCSYDFFMTGKEPK